MKYLIFFLFFFVSNLYAFNGRKCDHLMREKGGFRIATFLTTSSAQFLSSTGECSALGLNKEEQIKTFYYVNNERIKQDVAQGRGEYLDSFVQLVGCNQKTDLILRRELKNEFKILFVNDLEQSYKNLVPILDKNCKKTNQV